jgi:acyl carrier protein
VNVTAALTDDELRRRILALLIGVAPDIDPAAVRPELEYREQFDFDSMDLFNFAAAIHGDFGLDIPEKDYRQLAALGRCVAYLRGRLAGPQAGPRAAAP